MVVVVSTDVEAVELSAVDVVDVELLVELEDVVSEVVAVVVLTQEASETGLVVVDADVVVVVVLSQSHRASDVTGVVSVVLLVEVLETQLELEVLETFVEEDEVLLSTSIVEVV